MKASAACCSSNPRCCSTSEFAGHARLYGRDGRGGRLHLRRPGRRRCRRCALRDAVQSIRRQAEDAVRGGAVHIILTDEATDAKRAGIPMILATGAVHTHLLRQQLRTFTSLNVRSGECMDVHHAAVLVGVGATTVNAYVAEASIADRHRRGLFGHRSLEECLKRYREALDQGLLKIMSKMGISVICQLSRRRLLRSPRPVAHAGCRILPRHALAHLRHRHDRHPAPGAGPPPRAWREDMAALPIGGFYRYPQGRRSPCLGSEPDPSAAIGGDQRGLSDLQEIQRGAGKAPADRHPRSARLRSERSPRSPSTRWNPSPRSASASTRPACRWARYRPRRMARSTSP